MLLTVWNFVRFVATCKGTMGVDKVFSWVTFLILLCGCVNGNYVGLSPEEGSQTRHKSGRRNEPQAQKFEHLDQSAPLSLLCNEKNMTLIVKADLHNNGIRISTEELQLGRDPSSGSSCRAFAFSDIEYVIEASLHECGTLLTIEEDSLVYSNVLSVSPMPTSSGIIRTSSAIIPIACHYLRRHVVSSEAVYPTWAPFTSTVAALDLLDFSLRLMAADWRSESSSKKYVFGELLHIEALVSLSGHVPLRIFMDTCIATMDPDMNSEPRYAFIQNHGCLSDAHVKGSHAQFMPRFLDEKLQVKMDAFVFPEGFPESEIYIACQLRVTAASESTDAMNKACSYVNGRWQSVDGEDAVCSCCDSTCQGSDTGVLYTLGLGPFTVAKKD
ncbi:zona pellucida sperm-binding protein 3-like [Anguilla anguilla]|uniref:zona pellucida sperm-binding protein 3-like n=1 Tax=Anguilla anguilla TaxID=7936 RepID=UPI0015AD61E5|nr:zona pellucida sperm-binding protein 3-like [Anguilla anguilla]